MVNYNVVTKVFRTDGNGKAEDLLSTYLNTVDSTKVIRALTAVKIGWDELLILLVHDA